MIENTREIYESLYPRIFNQHYGMCPEEFNRPFDYFERYDYLVNMIEEQNKEIERLKEEIKGYEQERERVLNIIDERNHKVIEYIENEMPCLWEVDDVWEDINGNYQHNYKEYDTQILLNKLKGVDKE